MNKIVLKLSAFLFILTLFSCNGDDNKDGDLNVIYEDEDTELYEFEAFSLAPYDINAMIYLPDATANIGAATDPKVVHELDDYKWDLYLGQNFHMHIEDWGDDNALAAHIENLKDHSHIYQIDYLEQSDNFIYYKSTLKVDGKVDSKKIGTEHVTYHVVGQHTIDGINYIFRTNLEGHPKPITDYMAKSIKSVAPIKPAS
ncbi:MAG: hypothetical protein R3277_10420 [Brumimicrobium sp.]|nr:hypothetical protein [Brumimicrobium sp.]